jgi:RNA polymerase subunit RPABC4/transcription elongation factor Spt4
MAKKELPIIAKGMKKSENWKGRLIIIHPEKSEIANKVKVNQSGEYGLR